ncbi:MAG: hypothetical protein WBZ24_11360 [Anaerolineales bacterium]|jgi:hypothetical protein
MNLVKWVLIVGVVLGSSGCAGRAPVPDLPGGTEVHDPVYIESTQILQLESFPVQVMLEVVGQLPDACHKAAWVVSDPDSEGRIDVELHSEAPLGQDCIQVLQPMTLRIPIGSFKDGSYVVWLNGEKVGDFSFPG